MFYTALLQICLLSYISCDKDFYNLIHRLSIISWGTLFIVSRNELTAVRISSTLEKNTLLTTLDLTPPHNPSIKLRSGLYGCKKTSASLFWFCPKNGCINLG